MQVTSFGKAEQTRKAHMSFLRDVFAAVADAAGQMSKDQMREALLRAGLSPTPVQVSALSVAVMLNESLCYH
jgi:hypothetical protein